VIKKKKEERKIRNMKRRNWFW